METQTFADVVAADPFGLVVILAIIGALIYGGIKTFQRNWIAALGLMIFISPIWAIWAIVEIFRGKVQPKVHQVEVVNKNA